MDQKKPFENFKDKKFTNFNKNCFNHSPKLKILSPTKKHISFSDKKKKIQQSILRFTSPDSVTKRIIKFSDIPKANSTVKRALVFQSDEVITVDDNDDGGDDNSEISKITVQDKFNDCINSLEELRPDRPNTMPHNQKDCLHTVCGNTREFDDQHLSNPTKQTNNTDITSEQNKNDPCYAEISPAKSNLSDKELHSLVNDINWWDTSDFETDEQIRDPGCSYSCERNILDSSKFYDQFLSTEINNLQVDAIEDATSLQREQTDKPQTDLIDYIINTPPAIIAWKTIFSSHKSIYDNFMSLCSEEKKFYSTLYLKKNEWIQIQDSSYDFVSDIKVSLTNLINTGFIEYLDPNTQDLSFTLNLLSHEEIKKFCKMILVSKKGKKSILINNIMQRIRGQTTINFGNTSPIKHLKQQIINDLPTFLKLKEEPRKVFTSFLIISTYSHLKNNDDNRDALVTELLTKLNNGNIQELKLPLTSVPPIFKSLAKFEEYEYSLTLISYFLQAKKNKNGDQALATILVAKQELIKFLKNEENLNDVENMLDYLREYTSGANYVYILDEGISVLKNWKGTNGALMKMETAECLMLLLTQNYYKKGRRAYWNCELSLFMERCKEFDNVFLTLHQGLKEDSSILGNMLLSDRCQLLINRKIGLSIPQKKDLLELMNKQPCRYNTNDITAPMELQRMTIEEIVRQHYLNIGYKICNEGLNDKGHTVINIVLSTFWKVIYDPLEGMFHVRLQDRPIDWGSSTFYHNRVDLIKKHKKCLMNSGIDGIMAEIINICKQFSGTLSLVSWEVIKLKNMNDIKSLLKCIGCKTFLEISVYLLQSYEERSVGFPDLTLWNTEKNKPLFVVIKKKITDKLSAAQKLWFQKLNEFGLEGELCSVNNLNIEEKNSSNHLHSNFETSS